MEIKLVRVRMQYTVVNVADLLIMAGQQPVDRYVLQRETRAFRPEKLLVFM